MELLDRFDIKTDNMHIYDTAFSHSSYCNEHNLTEDYQRLEFLGDKVLDLIMSDYLYNTTNYEEGNISSVMDGEIDEFIEAYLKKEKNIKKEENL